MIGENGYGFRSMALTVGALVIAGALVTSETIGRFDRVLINERTKQRPTKPGKTTTAPTTQPTAPTNALYTEASFVPTNFDINSELVPSWGSGAIPVSAAPDPVGAFRFICNAGQLLSDDPIAYPGQPGASHLHQFFGNTQANASSTYSSLRQSGMSTCMSPLNRSAYWMPAMLDGKGNVVRPDYVTVYYKRRPMSDPKCSLTSGDIGAEGNCIPLPNGLRFIFGYNMANPADTPTGAAYFNCDGPTGTQGHYPTITAAMANCPTKQNADGSFNRLGAVIGAPSCWDGKNLDSVDHRSHVAYQSYGFWGYAKCPATHPFVIPTFTMGVWYTVDANLGTWRLSSDEMMPGTTPGTTFHADWFGAWDNNVQAMWLDNCINKLLNCSGGDLGNGKQLKMFSSFSWTANPRLVPVSNAPVAKILVSEGDSISVFWGGNHTGVYAKARPQVTFHGLAVGGSAISTLAARASGVMDRNPKFLTVLIGANDLTSYGSPQAFLDKLYAYTDPMRAHGIKVAVGTILPQYVPTNSTYQATFNSYRATVNANLRASTRIDAIIDFAADPVMGPDAAAKNVGLYHDGIHPTDGCGVGCGGQGKLEVVYQKAVDALVGL